MNHFSRYFLLAILSLVALLSSAYASATSIIAERCITEFGDDNGCECASRKTKEFAGADRFGNYTEFFAMFSERSADAQSDDDMLSAWNSAIGRYSKEKGEEYFDVVSSVQDMDAVHRYGLRFCGVQPVSDREKPSQFYWGEPR